MKKIFLLLALAVITMSAQSQTTINIEELQSSTLVSTKQNTIPDAENFKLNDFSFTLSSAAGKGLSITKHGDAIPLSESYPVLTPAKALVTSVYRMIKSGSNYILSVDVCIFYGTAGDFFTITVEPSSTSFNPLLISWRTLIITEVADEAETAGYDVTGVIFGDFGVLGN